MLRYAKHLRHAQNTFIMGAMDHKPHGRQENDTGEDRDRSLYDPDPVPEEDLWFLPGPDDEEAGGEEDLCTPSTILSGGHVSPWN